MPKTPDPTRIVADADVLAADVFLDGDARTAMDAVRAHAWLDLVVSDPLLDDAEAIIAALGDARLADDWRTIIESRCRTVDHPDGDHPGIASAYAAGAAHLLTLDDRLTSPEAGVAIRQAMPMSARTPSAFVKVFDPGALYEATFDDDYPGPDADPRG